MQHLAGDRLSWFELDILPAGQSGRLGGWIDFAPSLTCGFAQMKTIRYVVG